MIIKNDELTLDTDLMTVHVHTGFSGDGTTNLTNIETKILAHLLQNVGKLCSHQDLMLLFKGEYLPWDTSLVVYISRIRKKIGLNHFTSDRFIKTVRGKGYAIM
jgi:DNA-binding response OmpR family regulator